MYSDPVVSGRVRRLEVDWLRRDGDDEDAPLALAESSNTRVTFPSSEDLVREMIQAVRQLHNVTEYTIEWRHLCADPFLSFLTAAWISLGPKLSKLTLKAGNETLQALIPTAAWARFDSLEELGIHLRSGGDYDQGTLSNFVAPFVNQTAPSLRHLSILSYTQWIDLAPLFASLGHFPRL